MKKITILLAIAGYLTIATAQTQSLDKTNCIPGTIGGSIDISPTGAATYQLPIQVSPGSHGMQPNLSIVYSSQSGNGLLGWGWNLAGISSISRASKNSYYDGRFEAIALSDSDKFVLDGVRLIKRNLTNIFNPVNNPYINVTYNNVSFTVMTQDGTIIEYGNTPDSRVFTKNGIVPITWVVNKITDADGNYIQYFYTNSIETGELKISEIKYAGNSISQKEPYNSIKFYYDLRNDSNTSFIAGGSAVQSSILTAIRVYADGVLSKEYGFRYNFDGYSKLSAIELSADGVKYNPTLINWGSMPNYTIVAENASLGTLKDFELHFGDFNGDGRIDIAKSKDSLLILNIAMNGGGYSTYNSIIPFHTKGTYDGFNIKDDRRKKSLNILDWDNDGRDDIVLNTILCRRSIEVKPPRHSEPDYPVYELFSNADAYSFNGTGLSTKSIASVITNISLGATILTLKDAKECNFYFADFNNDGNMDMLTVKDKILTNCSGFSVPTLPSIPDIADIKMMDFDGDGQIEFLALTKKTINQTDKYYGSIWKYNKNAFICKYGGDFNLEFGDPRDIFIGDFNGDGKSDYLTFLNNSWAAKYSTGTNFYSGFVPSDFLNNKASQTGEYFYEKREDMNIVYESLRTNTGLCYFGATIINQKPKTAVYSPATTILVDDINNDGKSDIIQAVNGIVCVFTSTGMGFTKQTSATVSTVKSTDINKIRLYSVDFDNSGQKQLIYGNDDYPFTSNLEISSSLCVPNRIVVTPGNAVHECYKRIRFTNPLDQNLYVSSITDGIGNKSQFTYTTYTDNRQYTTSFPKPTFPLILIRGPMRIVNSIVTTNGVQTLTNITNTYADGYLHAGGLGFLGFKTFTSNNSISGSTTTNIFEHTIPSTSDIYSPWLKKQTTIVGATPVSEITNEVAALNLSISNKSFIQFNQKVTSKDLLKGIASTVNSEFDLTVGRVTKRTSLYQCPNTSSWEETVSTTYDLLSNSFSRPSSVNTTRTHDGDLYSSTTTITYEGTGFRVKTKTANGLTTTYSDWDSYGNPQKVTVTDGTNTRITEGWFDEKGRAIVRAKDVFGVETSYTYRFSDGVKLTETSPLGTTEYKPTVQGGSLNTKATFPNGTISSQEMGWDASGSGYYSKESVTNGNTATTFYNELWQKVKQTQFGFSGALLTSTYSYNAKGQLVYETLPGVATPTSYTYNSLGLLINTSGHNGQSVTYSYSGNTVTANNSITGTETKCFDALGNVVSINSPNGSITYSYFASGKVKSITANGANTSMTYDQQGNQLSLTDPNAGKTEYQYNGFGQLTWQKDAKGNIITCAYDQNTGQLQSKSGTNESYTYYTLSEDSKRAGLLKTATRGNVTETYTYDDWRRTAELKTSANSKDYITAFSYNDEKRLEQITYPTGLKLKYIYDDFGNTKEILQVKASGATSIWKGNPKNAREQWTSFELGNGLKTQWGYDGEYMLNSIQTGISSNANSVQNLEFSSNSKGQLDWRKDGLLKEDFIYDPQNRLTSSVVNGLNPITYKYANNGNIDSTSLVGKYNYDIPGKTHAVGSIGIPAGTSLGAGSISTISTFMVDNRIATMDNGTYKNEFTYGPSGNRTIVDQFENGNKIFTKVYAGGSEFIYNASGAVVCKRTIISAPTGVCAVYQDSAGLKTIHYIHTDYLGSWLAITDSTGSLTNRYSYDAWGRPRNPNTWVLLPIGVANALVNLNAMQPRFDRGYTGHEHMAGFGLINMNGRLYDPYLQRFLSPDPFVQSPNNAQNYNRYTYCLNNPLIFTDPSGYNVKPILQTNMELASMLVNRYSGSSCSYGGAGFGWNGSGLGGVFYDWYSGNYRSVDDGGSVSWGYVYNSVVVPNRSEYYSGEIGINQFKQKYLGEYTITLHDPMQPTTIDLSTLRGVLLPMPYGAGENGYGDVVPVQDQIDINNGQVCAPWYYGIPGVGPALESGDNLGRGNYYAAAAAFGMALVDVFTLGGATAEKAIIKTGTNVVYRGIDAAGVVRYVGITERNATVRFGEHAVSIGTGREFLKYSVIDGATGLSRIDARIWEQTLINQYGLEKNGGLLLNKVNSIAPRYWWLYGITP